MLNCYLLVAFVYIFWQLHQLIKHAFEPKQSDLLNLKLTQSQLNIKMMSKIYGHSILRCFFHNSSLVSDDVINNLPQLEIINEILATMEAIYKTIKFSNTGKAPSLGGILVNVLLHDSINFA